YNDKRTYASVGYIPFSERDDTPAKLLNTAEKLRNHELPEPMPLVVQTHSDITTEVLTADVAIIGTGAAASILAHGLTRAGRQVLMLERGDHEIPATFTEDEAYMLTRLYGD